MKYFTGHGIPYMFMNPIRYVFGKLQCLDDPQIIVFKRITVYQRKVIFVSAVGILKVLCDVWENVVCD